MKNNFKEDYNYYIIKNFILYNRQWCKALTKCLRSSNGPQQLHGSRGLFYINKHPIIIIYFNQTFEYKFQTSKFSTLFIFFLRFVIFYMFLISNIIYHLKFYVYMGELLKCHVYIIYLFSDHPENSLIFLDEFLWWHEIYFIPIVTLNTDGWRMVTKHVAKTHRKSTCRGRSWKPLAAIMATV